MSEASLFSKEDIYDIGTRLYCFGVYNTLTHSERVSVMSAAGLENESAVRFVGRYSARPVVVITEGEARQ